MSGKRTAEAKLAALSSRWGRVVRIVEGDDSFGERESGDTSIRAESAVCSSVCVLAAIPLIEYERLVMQNAQINDALAALRSLPSERSEEEIGSLVRWVSDRVTFSQPSIDLHKLVRA